jgi:oligoendopeptidase F
MNVIIGNMALLELGRVRGDLESFQSELMEEFYRNFAGLKDDLSTVPIYERYSHLFSADAIDSMKKVSEEISPEDDSRWLKYLESFSTLGYVENAVKSLTDRITTWEATKVVSFGGEDIPYRMIPVKLRNEPDTENRHKLFEAKLEAMDELNGMHLDRIRACHDTAVELGFKTYRDMCSHLKGVDYKALENDMEDLLKKTEKLYVDAMEPILQDKLKLSMTDAWSCDIPSAFKGNEYDSHFSKERLVPAFRETLKGMGIDPDGYPNIMIDTEDREKKTPRAFCAPVKVPEDVKLVIRPMGGWKDYEAFFHEGGHAWHFGNTKRDLPAEYRYLGDNSVTEAFAFLFDYLVTNKLWLKRYLGMERAEEFERFALINKLMFLRRYAAKLIYEMKLHQGTVTPEMGEVYKATLQKSLKLRHTEKHYLEDVDDAFYCAEYLRAWIFEGQLREAMMEKYGDEWFENENAGEYLKELWSYGQKFKAEELVQTVGYVELDPESLMEEIELGLRE